MISHNKVMLHSQAAFTYFIHLWSSQGQSPFSLFRRVAFLYFQRCSDDKSNFSEVLGMPQNPSLKITNPKMFFPACYFFPSPMLQVNLQQKGSMNHDFGWKTCYLKAFPGFCGCQGEHQQAPGEVKTEGKEAPLICLRLHLFLSKKQEGNHKSHNGQVSITRDTPEGSTSTAALILWPLTQFSRKDGSPGHPWHPPPCPGLPSQPSCSNGSWSLLSSVLVFPLVLFCPRVLRIMVRKKYFLSFLLEVIVFFKFQSK